MPGLRTLHVVPVATMAAILFALAAGVSAQDKTGAGQALLKIDLADPEITAFRQARGLAAGGDDAKLKGLKVPVLAFATTPQLVKAIAGSNAQPTKPRSIVTDPKEPYWYHISDTYEGISISVDADRRINHEGGKSFQIGAPKLGAANALGTNAKPNITVLDNGSEEGMEGLLIEYTVQKYPNIPYTVTISCSGKSKAQCKDLAVITKDQSLLTLIAVPAP
jgi:hypothetical protein